MYVFSKKLAKVRNALKSYKWEPDSLISQLSNLKMEQEKVLRLLDSDPSNNTLLLNISDINIDIMKWPGRRAFG